MCSRPNISDKERSPHDFVLIDATHCQRPSAVDRGFPVGCTERQTWLTSVVVVDLLHYLNGDKIDGPFSDPGDDI